MRTKCVDVKGEKLKYDEEGFDSSSDLSKEGDLTSTGGPLGKDFAGSHPHVCAKGFSVLRLPRLACYRYDRRSGSVSIVLTYHASESRSYLLVELLQERCIHKARQRTSS